MSTCYNVSEIVENDGEREWGCVADGTKYPDEYTDGDGIFLVESENGVGYDYVVNSPVVAILSSPIIFDDGTYQNRSTEFPADLSGKSHYVGHPATRALLEALGAQYMPGRWAGPKIGESYLAVPLALNAREGGWTQDQAVENVAQLRAILITRLA